MQKERLIAASHSEGAQVTLHLGDRNDLLRSLPDEAAHLVVTSPPYNLGKAYEKRTSLSRYLEAQRETIEGAVRVLNGHGSLCWQVGNYVDSGEVYPLDAVLYPIFKSFGLRLRNRIVWHFEHGLHCQRRLSGRYETILWFTKGDDYVFNLDPIRVPSKYPGKRYYKGPKAGQYSCNPLGKNPGDVWVFPNVKHNHVEKTIHPCQFPVELVERLVLSMTNPGQLVVDPYMGVGSTAVAAVMHGRRVAGADIMEEYLSIARERVELAARGELRTRAMGTPVYEPPANSSLLSREDCVKPVGGLSKLPDDGRKVRL
jgi:adenine-specific DNA-methyltransferase